MSAREKVSKAVTVLGVKILDIYMNNHANLIIIIMVFLKVSIFDVLLYFFGTRNILQKSNLHSTKNKYS